jgi:hypothetical protein
VVEDPDYTPLDEEHKKARRAATTRIADVQTAKRFRQPRDLNRLMILLSTVVGVIMIVATTIAVYSFVVVLRQQKDLKDEQEDSVVNRKTTSDAFCSKLNGTIRSSQAQVDTLNSLILQSVRASRAFEETYKSLGFPDYATRLKNAERQTDALARRKPHEIDCRALADSIQRAAR